MIVYNVTVRSDVPGKSIPGFVIRRAVGIPVIGTAVTGDALSVSENVVVDEETYALV